MTEGTAAGVVITTKDIYDKLVDVEKQVVNVTTQAQTLLDHETRLRQAEAAIPSHLEDRVRSLEKWKNAVPPTIIAAAIAVVQQLLSHKG